MVAGVASSRLVLVTTDFGGPHHPLHLGFVEIAHSVLHPVVWVVKAVFKSVLPCLRVHDYVSALLLRALESFV